jgi:hypothetical protein
MQVTTELRQDDHTAFTRYVWYSGSRGSWARFVLLFAGAAVTTGLLESQASLHLDTPTMLVTVAILLGYLELAQRRVRPLPDGASLGMRTFRLVDAGLLERSRHHENLTHWTGIHAVDESRHHVFVFIDNCHAHIIPKRGFADEGQCRAFVEQLRNGVLHAAVPAVAPTIGPTLAPLTGSVH